VSDDVEAYRGYRLEVRRGLTRRFATFIHAAGRVSRIVTAWRSGG
jgi:hypothetical protein